MIISLIPQRRDDSLTLVKNGEILVINGRSYDLSVIPDGAILPRDAIDCDWLAADVERVGGDLRVSLFAPHGADATPAARNPRPIVNPPDGPVELPS